MPSLSTVSAVDVVVLIDAMFPQQVAMSPTSMMESLESGVRSSASSMSGFSLFRTFDDSQPADQPAGPHQYGYSTHDDDRPSMDLETLFQARDQIRRYIAGTEHETDGRYATLVLSPVRQAYETLAVYADASVADKGGRSQHGGPDLHGLTGILRALFSSDTVLHVCRSWNDLCDTDAISFVAKRLEQHMRAEISAAEADSDFVNCYFWHEQLNDFHARRDGDYLPLIRDVLWELVHGAAQTEREQNCKMALYGSLTESTDDHILAVQSRLGDESSEMHDLRLLMWYSTDVRSSAAYDEARSVIYALRMMGPPLATRSSVSGRQSTSVKTTKYSSSRPGAQFAQMLEITGAPLLHGGPNKLSDEQARATSVWMERTGIENLCRGEERLHRMCMAIEKCVTAAMMGSDKSVTGNSLLPSLVHPARATTNTPFATATPQPLRHTIGRKDFGPDLFYDGYATIGGQIGFPTTFEASVDDSNSRRSMSEATSTSFWSRTATDIISHESDTSVGSSRPCTKDIPPRTRRGQSTRLNITDPGGVRRYVCHVLMGDLGACMFDDGSETDRAFWTETGGELTQEYLRTLYPNGSLSGAQVSEALDTGLMNSNSFDFRHAFLSMLQRFSNSADPYTKLDILCDIQQLLPAFAAWRDKGKSRAAGSHRGKTQSPEPRQESNISFDANIDGFRRLFGDPHLRPRTIFRDLQYIASLVPSVILSSKSEGKAFWNAAAAISGIKQDVRVIMVETADRIIGQYSNDRGHINNTSTAQKQRDFAAFAPISPHSAEVTSSYDMLDAAHLLQVTAKEGDPVAQRELATLYLTHPEVMDRIIAPFARPRDVFKGDLENRWKKNQDPNRCDPMTMCVAHHWMSLSSKGGDALATEYLRQREEMDRLP